MCTFCQLLLTNYGAELRQQGHTLPRLRTWKQIQSRRTTWFEVYGNGEDQGILWQGTAHCASEAKYRYLVKRYPETPTSQGSETPDTP